MQSLYSQQRTRIGTSAGAHTRSPKIMGHCWICVISVCIPLSTWILWICKLTNRYFVVSSLLFFKYIYTNKQQRVRERETSIFGSLFSWVARSFSFGFYSSKRKAHRMVNLKTQKKKGNLRDIVLVFCIGEARPFVFLICHRWTVLGIFIRSFSYIYGEIIKPSTPDYHDFETAHYSSLFECMFSGKKRAFQFLSQVQ